jgi:SAM-dependent methyltransferase
MDFTCNVCGASVHDCPIEQIDREIESCPYCYSIVRKRGIVHLLSVALFGRSIPLPQFPMSKAIGGLGMSDWDGYALSFARKFSYTNTFFHCEPFLDITAPLGKRAGTCDFVISSDVFEHVAPQVEHAFRGALDLLKPGGHFIFTVPYSLDPEIVEHFPALHDYRIIQFDNDYVLVNRLHDRRGRCTSVTGPEGRRQWLRPWATSGHKPDPKFVAAAWRRVLPSQQLPADEIARSCRTAGRSISRGPPWRSPSWLGIPVGCRSTMRSVGCRGCVSRRSKRLTVGSVKSVVIGE